MRREVFILPLALLFIATVPCIAQQSEELVLYDVGRNLSLRCTLPNEKAAEYIWKKNETSVLEGGLKERYKTEEGGAVLSVSGRAQEDDWGNYSCGVAGGALEQRWRVHGRPHVKLPANTNVVEGEKLKIQCKVIGKPYPKVTWTYSNASASEEVGGASVEEALGGRAQLRPNEQGVEDAQLVVEAAARDDAGLYACAVGNATAATTLRVKDMYAALWPFLGICAEVFVLCAIILVYEKRRTKPELDDSDTDNHDQKKS